MSLMVVPFTTLKPYQKNDFFLFRTHKAPLNQSFQCLPLFPFNWSHLYHLLHIFQWFICIWAGEKTQLYIQGPLTVGFPKFPILHLNASHPTGKGVYSHSPAHTMLSAPNLSSSPLLSSLLSLASSPLSRSRPSVISSRTNSQTSSVHSTLGVSGIFTQSLQACTST